MIDANKPIAWPVGIEDVSTLGYEGGGSNFEGSGSNFVGRTGAGASSGNAGEQFPEPPSKPQKNLGLA